MSCEWKESHYGGNGTIAAVSSRPWSCVHNEPPQHSGMRLNQSNQVATFSCVIQHDVSDNIEIAHNDPPPSGTVETKKGVNFETSVDNTTNFTV